MRTKIDTQIAVIEERTKNIDDKVSSIQKRMESDYVIKEEFEPVKRIVYGLVALILIAVVGALITMILYGGK